MTPVRFAQIEPNTRCGTSPSTGDGRGWEGVWEAMIYQDETKLIPACPSSGNVLPVPHTGAVATNERWGISGAREVVPWRVQDLDEGWALATG